MGLWKLRCLSRCTDMKGHSSHMLASMWDVATGFVASEQPIPLPSWLPVSADLLPEFSCECPLVQLSGGLSSTFLCHLLQVFLLPSRFLFDVLRWKFCSKLCNCGFVCVVNNLNQWCKQDQILNSCTTKTKTKITKPRPLEVNKGACGFNF